PTIPETDPGLPRPGSRRPTPSPCACDPKDDPGIQRPASRRTPPAFPARGAIPKTPAPRPRGHSITFRRKCRYVIQFHLPPPGVSPPPPPTTLGKPPAFGSSQLMAAAGHRVLHEIGHRSHQHLQHPGPGCAALAERHETLVPVRSNALEARFHSVR